jgi:hypothetical protein
MFTISSLSTAYIFLKYLSLEYCCTISLYKVTDITHYQFTNPLGFSSQVTKYVDYGEWIKLLELRD